MKKWMMIVLAVLAFNVFNVQKADAQVLEVAQIIKAGVKKVIRAIDLKIQRLQNKTIWLQNAQKTMENFLSKSKLGEIGGWLDHQKEIYRVYYEELSHVKLYISNLQRLREIGGVQARLLQEYSNAWRLLKEDKHFKPHELVYMKQVYDGILDESLKNMDQILLVVNSFETQMSDAKRKEIIDQAAEKVEINYQDLIRFNRENAMYSINMASSIQEIESLRKMYGIEDWIKE